MKYFALALLSLLMTQKIYAAPCPNIQLQTAQTVIDFSSSSTVNPTFTVKSNTNPGGCDFFVAFDYGYSSSYANRSLKMGGTQWPFQISKDSSGAQIIKNFPDISSNNDVLTGVLADGSSDQQVNISYWAVLNQTNPWVRFGNFSETITAHLYKGTISNYTFVESRVLTFQYNAPKRVDISVVSSGGSFNINSTTGTMNFGVLVSGANRTCDVILKYNAGYILKASSANDGRLKHQTQNSYIPYAISFRGTTVSLNGSSSSPVQVFRELGQSPASGLVLPVSATIGNMDVVQTGIYGDTITLTVESAE